MSHSKFRMYLLGLLVAQAICLAFGLFLQGRLADFMLEAKSIEHAEPAVVAGEIANSQQSPPTDKLAMRILAFTWILGLQSGAAYLIFSRLEAEHTARDFADKQHAVERDHDLAKTQNAVIFGLARLSESRDPETGKHLERIAHYSTCLARALRRHPRYRHQVTPTFVRLIGISSALHDIGKVGIEDKVLLKQGKLTSSERFLMQVHAALGGECIREIEQQLGSSNFLQMAREIAMYHHERWDGAGYPEGLTGERIPLAARIVSIADVYDALSVKRVYKEAYPHETCVEIIRKESGKHFDPNLVEVFLGLADQFRAIAQRFRDNASDTAQPSRRAEAVGHCRSLEVIEAEVDHLSRVISSAVPDECVPVFSDEPQRPDAEALA